MPKEVWPEEELYQELVALSNTAGLQVVDYLVQHRRVPDSTYYIGKGKLEEVQQACLAWDVDCVIFDHALSPSQLYHLGEELGVKVLDKTMLILDIFAQRARSKEGKLQVELAQSIYLLPRLLGQGMNLSRQGSVSKGNGVGTRGPGETKLETDRRRIHQRIQTIQHALEEVRRHRAIQQKRKRKNRLPLISIIGYTNAGKSSLLNILTEEQIYVEDQLFATLDPTTRSFLLPNSSQVLLTDTVGFIRDLPESLVEAFQATLDELQYADLLLHVIDVSNPNFENQFDAVEQILRQLHLEEKPRIYVFNKIDRLQEIPPLCRVLPKEDCCYISVSERRNLDELLQCMQKKLKKMVVYRVILPVSEGKWLYQAYAGGRVQQIEYTEKNIYFEWHGSEEQFPASLDAYRVM